MRALRGRGTKTEAYALYNLAYARFALGECRGVLSLLTRSRRIQGERSDITELYNEAYETCVQGDSSGSGGGDGDD